MVFRPKVGTIGNFNRRTLWHQHYLKKSLANIYGYTFPKNFGICRGITKIFSKNFDISALKIP